MRLSKQKGAGRHEAVALGEKRGAITVPFLSGLAGIRQSL